MAKQYNIKNVTEMVDKIFRQSLTQHSDDSFLPLVDSPAKNRNIIIYVGQTVDTILMALMYHPDYEYFHNTTVIREY